VEIRKGLEVEMSENLAEQVIRPRTATVSACLSPRGRALDGRPERSSVKRRKNQIREALYAKREALTRAANEPKPEKQPDWEPETPELRAEVLADRLEEREAELAKEQQRRRRRRG
jgi:hypothetical protein